MLAETPPPALADSAGMEPCDPGLGPPHLRKPGLFILHHLLRWRWHFTILGSVRGRGVNSRTALAGIGVAIGPCG